MLFANKWPHVLVVRLFGVLKHSVTHDPKNPPSQTRPSQHSGYSTGNALPPHRGAAEHRTVKELVLELVNGKIQELERKGLLPKGK